MDKKDYDILYELSKNSRIPVSQIAKKARLSKDAVIYRMKKYEEEKIVQHYQTVVDLQGLSYRTHIILLELKTANTQEEEEIVSYLAEHPYIIWVASSGGRWDIIIDIISKSTEQFDTTVSEILNKIASNLKEYEIIETIKEFYYNHQYLTNKKIAQYKERVEPYQLDNVDIKLLELLSLDARKKATELARSLGISHDQVSYRIKKMRNASIIKQFTAVINFNKLNLNYYYVFLKLNQMTKTIENKLLEFLKSQKQVVFIGKNVGKFTFNVDVVVHSPIELKDFFVRLRSEFGEIVESRESLLMFEQRKNNYVPKGVVSDIYENR